MPSSTHTSMNSYSTSSSTSSTSACPTGVSAGDELGLLLIGTSFFVVLLIVLVLFFYFSTSILRRRLIFILLSIIITSGVVQGGILTYDLATIVLNSCPSPTYLAALISTFFFVPILAQSLHMFHVVQLYPPRLLSRSTSISIYVPTITLKLGRVVNFCLCVARLHDSLRLRLSENPGDAFAAALAVQGLPELKAEIVLQLIDNILLVCLLFLPRTNTSRSGRRTTMEGSVKGVSHNRAPAIVRAIGLILPVIVNFIFLVVAFAKIGQFTLILYFLLCNNFIVIICVTLSLTQSSLWSATPGDRITSPSPYLGSTTQGPPHDTPEVPSSDTTFSPWSKNTFTESIRDSSTQVGDSPPDEKWKAELIPALEKEYVRGTPLPPSLLSSTLFDNRGEPVCYAV